MKSIIQQKEGKCYICGRTSGVFHKHHFIGGTSNRENSEKFGLHTEVCPACHAEIHETPTMINNLQKIAELSYTINQMRMFLREPNALATVRKNFRDIFGKNYAEYGCTCNHSIRDTKHS